MSNVFTEPRKSAVFIGSECYPFVKTGGLGDVMYALPRTLTARKVDCHVFLPLYECIPQRFQEKLVSRGSFYMDLCSDGRSFYVGVLECELDGVVYDFIDNKEFFSGPKPYINLVDDIPRFCYFSKAAMAAILYLNLAPDIIHCHDWQAALCPVYLRTLFANTELGRARSVLTIHNLRFQGVYNQETLRYWSGLPEEAFRPENMGTNDQKDANMLKGGIAYADRVTTVSATYAEEIKTPFYGENLDLHLNRNADKLLGIVNGIDCDVWNPAKDKLLPAAYTPSKAKAKKRANKLALQKRLGLEQDAGKFVIGLISRLTDQKGLDILNEILYSLVDEFTQVVVLGTGEPMYENAFRAFEAANRGRVCSYIAYDEALSHQIYAGADALLVPSLFEPCGLTQLIAMRYGTIPIVRETGGLKDTVEPYNWVADSGNGFTFDRYESGLLLDAVNRAKTLYFENRPQWDAMVRRDMKKDVSWQVSAGLYRDLYLELLGQQ